MNLALHAYRPTPKYEHERQAESQLAAQIGRRNKERERREAEYDRREGITHGYSHEKPGGWIYGGRTPGKVTTA